MKNESVYLSHILDCIGRIEVDTASGREAFLESHTLQDAVLRNLQVLAESTQHLSDAIKSTQPAMNWLEISAFRNVLVHDYLGIDLEAIWNITQRDIPDLKKATLSMMKDT